MEPSKIEALLAEQSALAKRSVAYARLTLIALLVVVLGSALTLSYAWQELQRNMAPTVEDMRAAMEDIKSMSAETKALLQEARYTMQEVREATSAVAPVVEEARGAIQEAQETTQRVEEATAPLELFRTIPILNWFIP